MLYLENININTYHKRGLHWTLGKKASHIQIMLNFGQSSNLNEGIPIIMKT